jgi:hypothetical protein
MKFQHCIQIVDLSNTFHIKLFLLVEDDRLERWVTQNLYWKDEGKKCKANHIAN